MKELPYPLFSNLQIEPISTANKNSGTFQNSNTGNEKENLSEEIPDPSPLVVPGYNLPENIFNRGKPFYLEKDPLTGIINFDSKPTLSDVQEDDFQEYEENSSKPNIFDKNNIDRKDTAFGSHKSSDVNQLVPNFHDFLNLPVKYNSDKYVYPLISSSYANTKVQGNVNKQQNHKNYAHLVTQKPTTASYYYTSQSQPHTITKENMEVRPSESEDDYSYEEYDFTTRANTDHIYLTTSRPTVATPITAATTTTTTTLKPTTTKKTMSLFQQLFGDYDEADTEATPSVHYMSDNRHTSSTIAPSSGGSSEYEYQYEDDIVDNDSSKVIEVKANSTKATSTTTTSTTTSRTTTTTTTTMPPPQKHYYLNSEAVTEKTTTTITNKANNHPTPFRQPENVAYQTVPSTTIHIPPHQNTVSFLVGNHQKVGGEYVGTVMEEKVQVNDRKHTTDRDKFLTENSVNIQPFKHPEASLAIGTPVDRVKVVPGQVVDEKLNPNSEEYGKHKIVFPEEKQPGKFRIKVHG